VRTKVFPDREAKALKQMAENNALLSANPKAKVNKHHIFFYQNWWKLSYSYEELLTQIHGLKRYIACSRVSLRPIFEFVSAEINPSDALIVFCFEDDYSFGIIQSSFHWEWWKAKCSTLGTGYRYTANTVWDTFPFPQSPTQKNINAVAMAAAKLRKYRTETMDKNQWSLRDLYRTLDFVGKNPLQELHEALDKAVAATYLEGNTQTSEKFSSITSAEILPFLLALNLQMAAKEAKGEAVTPPDLPDWAKLP
jgi:hypothetical protein